MMTISITNWFMFFLVNLLALFSSYCLSSYFLRKGEPISLVLVASGIIYFVHITLSVLFLGVVLQYLNLVSVTTTSILLSVVIIFFFRKYNHPFLVPANQAIKEIFSERDYFLYGVLLLFVLQLIILTAKVVISPPHVWDVFVYHLTPAVEWYQQGMIPSTIESPVVRRINSQALGMTVLSYWFFIFLGHDLLVELPQFLWALLLVPVSYSILKQSGVSNCWSLKFSILLFFTPIVLMQSITSKDHLGLNVGFITALLFMSNFLRKGEYKQLIIAALTFGLILGYKIIAPLYLVIGAVVFLYLAYTNRRRLLPVKSDWLYLIKILSVSVGIMVAIGGYWHIKNIALYGTPLGLFISSDVQSATNTVQLSHNNIKPFLDKTGDYIRTDKIIRNLKQFLPRVFDYQSQYNVDISRMSGFGPQFAAFGLLPMFLTVGLLFVKKHRSEPINMFTWSAIALLLVYFLFYYTRFNYRVFSFIPLIFITYGAILLYKYGFFENKLSAYVINLMIAASILWNFIHILPPQNTNLKLLKEFISLEVPYQTSANYTPWFESYRPNFYRLLRYIPSDKTIAYISQPKTKFPRKIPPDTWTYLYYDRNWQRKLKYLYEPDYLECDINRICTPKKILKRTLIENGISLVSTCKVRRCLELSDPDFLKLTPGFYYFKWQN